MHSHICLLNPSRLSTQSISTQSISPFPIRATSIFSLGYEMGSGGVVWQRMAYTLKEWRIPSRLVLFISFSYTVYISLRVHTYRVHINLRVHQSPSESIRVHQSPYHSSVPSHFKHAYEHKGNRMRACRTAVLMAARKTGGGWNRHSGVCSKSQTAAREAAGQSNATALIKLATGGKVWT